MIVIPAIDLLDGRCVRLRQGDYNAVTVYSDRPEEVAMSFEEYGAELIHIVDLNGARSGDAVNFGVVEKIVKSISIPVEIGGGIRTAETANRYVGCGVRRIIVGTKACESPAFFGRLCDEVDADVIAGIDAKDGFVAVHGWTELSSQKAGDLAAELEARGAAGIIYTDISRDGMRTGPNVKATVELARSVGIPVIASGGVSSDEDILAFTAYARDGVYGVIVGKAIYEGDVNLKSVIRELREKNSGR